MAGGRASRSRRCRWSSRARGRARVSEATQEHVRRCARELGYRPNVAAQALRLGASRAVALLVPDITNPFFSRVLRGAQRAARSAGYTVALVDTANDRRWEEQTFEALRPGRWTATCSSRSIRSRGLGPGRKRRADGGRGATAAVGPLRRRGGRRGGVPPPRGARARACRAPRCQLRRADLPPARGGAPPRAGRGGARSRQPAARADGDRDRGRPPGGRAAARRAPDRRLLRRRPHSRRPLPGGARARHPPPARPVSRGVRRHGLRPRARAGAHHRRARCRAAGRQRLRAARAADVRKPDPAAAGAARRAPRAPGSTGPPPTT